MTESKLETRLAATQLGWFHRYPARFAHEALCTMLENVADHLKREPARVLDPFAGTGSTLALCKQLGIDSAGLEVSKLGTIVARLRLSPPPNLAAAQQTAIRLIELPAHKNARPNRELIEWLGSENAARAVSYVRRTRRIENVRLRRFLETVLSGSLRPASRWLAGSIKPQQDPTRRPSELRAHVARIAGAVARDCAMESALHTNASARISRADATRLQVGGTFDTVICSPPYFVSYDYIDVQRLSYLAFSWPDNRDILIGRRYAISPDGVGFNPPESLRQWYEREFAGEGSVLGRALRLYIQRMHMHLTRVFDRLEPRGAIAYSIANSIRRGREFPLAQALAELIEEVGFRAVDITARQTSSSRILPAGRDETTGRFSSWADGGVDEYIVYATKPR